tara:strand:+ start:65820 stop:66557 length:738 start_codon:yes stop_codon:yes gene_type:complete
LSDTSKGIENSTSKHQENHAFPGANGVPLSEAAFAFADINAEGLELTKRCLVLLKPALDGVPNDEPPNVYQAYEPKDGNARFNLHLRRQEHLFQHLFDNLFEGALVAHGRILSPELSSEVCEIPRELFSESNRIGDIDDWKNDQFRSLNYLYGSLVLSLNISPDLRHALKRKVGRKSSPGIEQAIEELVEIRADFWRIEGGRTKQCDLVRERIHGVDVDHLCPPAGYGDSAIKNRLRDLDPSQTS